MRRFSLTAWGVVDSMEQYYGILAGLKSFKRHLLSNMYMDDEEIQEYVRDGKLFFYYAPGKYVNYWKKEWDFARLYYYIADADCYEAPDIKSKIVCDLFFSKKAVRNDEAVELLRHTGFREYALFRKYIKKPDAEAPLGIDEDIAPGVAEGFYELLKECFDIYTDLVPEENTAQEYLEGQKCFTAVDKYGKLAGGAVISKKGSVETEEFVVVTPKMRGRGIARRLRRYAYAHTSDGTTKLVSWVRRDNERSWRQLLGFSYQDSGAYKITMMKG